MEAAVIYLGGDYLWMPVFPTGLSRTCLAQSRHSSHVCWMRENPCCIICCIKKNSVGHKYQKRTHAKLGKNGVRGIYGVSTWSLSTRHSLGLGWSPGGWGVPKESSFFSPLIFGLLLSYSLSLLTIFFCSAEQHYFHLQVYRSSASERD